jgi:CubicO group peptidase (beta-lactamase class C family)
LLTCLGVGLVGWRTIILVIERPGVTGPDSTITCPGVLDSAFSGAAGRARPQLRAMLAERGIPGLAVAAAVDGRVVWSEGLGLADREGRVPACPHQQFRLQSISKLVTTAAAVRLAERGVLRLDAPVRTYLPELTGELGGVTSRQLASHRSGVRHYRDDNESLNTTSYPTATASLEKFRDDPLLFPPDSGSSYSSYGFVLLSAALEGATGKDFPTIVAHEVAAPLGLRDLEAERPGDSVPGRVTFYDHVTPYSLDGSVVRSPSLDFSSKWGGGGLLGSPEALAHFGSAHIPPFNQSFLRDETLDEMFTPRTRQMVFFGQGLGWVTARDHRLRRVRLHFGAGSGGTSVIALYPDEKAVVAVVANLGHAGFPIRRLIAIAAPFVGDRFGPVAWLAGVGSLAAAVALARRRRS